MLRNRREREWAMAALMLAIGLTAVLSTLRWAGVIPQDVPFLRYAGYSPTVVFKFHLTQNLLVAFGAFLFAVQARNAATTGARCAWSAACALAIANVLVMGDGRIGQVVLIVLMLYFAIGFSSRPRIAAAVLMTAAVAAAAFLIPQSSLNRRSLDAATEASEWRSGRGAAKPSSVGERLDFYVTSARLAAKHPFIGVGTGGFPAAYAQEVAGTALEPTRNPHNEYLLRAVELGAIGVLLVIGLFVVVWRQARRLPTRTETAVARAVVTMFALTALASTPLADHTETLLFVWLVGVLFASYRPAVADPARPGALAPAGPRASGSA
jgi:O-antigen ligase